MEAKNFIVSSCRKIGQNHYFLQLIGSFSEDILPGQFVHIKVAPFFLRRPFSVASFKDNKLGILFQVAGRGTEVLAGSRGGEVLSVIGPLGTPFPVEAGNKNVWLAGGGTGIAPLLFLSARLSALKNGISYKLFYGARDKSQIFFDIIPPGGESFFATEDGSFGYRGLLTGMLKEHLADEPGPPDILYAGGPYAFLKEVASLAERENIETFVTLENRMACGTGLCYGCVTRIKSRGAWEYKRVCKEGPVFRAEEVEWE